MTVTLEPHEIMQASVVAVQMQTMNSMNGARPTFSAPTALHQALSLGIVGMLGEAAVAKALGLYWTGNVGDYTAKDVGPYQVRTTSRNDLRINRKDHDDDVFIGVRIRHDFTFDLMGWITARDAKIDRYWKAPQAGRPNYFVPRTDLAPIDTLPRRAT